ncbi:MAG: hypothetical protein Q7S37_01985 [bacterium]|nr:hypothetical protein [bacterium]
MGVQNGKGVGSVNEGIVEITLPVATATLFEGMLGYAVEFDNGVGTEQRYPLSNGAESGDEDYVPTVHELARVLGIDRPEWKMFALIRSGIVAPLHDSRVASDESILSAFPGNRVFIKGMVEPTIFRLARAKVVKIERGGGKSFGDCFATSSWGGYDEISPRLATIFSYLERDIPKDANGWFDPQGKLYRAIAANRNVSENFAAATLRYFADVGVLEAKGNSHCFYRIYPALTEQEAGYKLPYDIPLGYFCDLTMTEIHSDPLLLKCWEDTVAATRRLNRLVIEKQALEQLIVDRTGRAQRVHRANEARQKAAEGLDIA